MKTKKEELQAELTRLNALRKQVKEKLKALPIEQDKFAELKEAHRNGSVIEFRSKYTNFEWDVTLDPAWSDFSEYRIKPQEKPKVGDVCKFWNEYDDVFIVGIYAELRNRDDQWDDNNTHVHGVRLGVNYYTTFFKHAKTLTQQEAIDLLFNKGAN